MSCHEMSAILSDSAPAEVQVASGKDTNEAAYNVQDFESKLGLIASMSPTHLPGEHHKMTPEVVSITRYFHSMEQRVKSLEAQVAQLTGSTVRHGESSSSVSRFPRYSTSASARRETLRLNRDEFESPDSRLDAIHAIELLVDDDAIIKIRIRSEQLLKIFQVVMGPDLAPDPSKSAVMTRPFKALMQYSGQFEEYKASLRQELAGTSSSAKGLHKGEEHIELDKSLMTTTMSWLDLLIEAFKADLSDDYVAYTALIERSAKTVSFLHLCFLFQPGNLVIEGSGTSIQAYRIRSVHGSTLRSHQDAVESFLEMISNSFVLNCFSVGYDGKTFGPIPKAFTIMPFLGSKEVTKLPVMPIEYLGDTEIQTKLISRGNQFYSLRKPSYKSYSGLSLDRVAAEVNGEVMVDFELYYRQNPDTAPTIGFKEFVEESDRDVPNSGIYDDNKVDKYLTEVFLKSHAEYLEVSEPNDKGDSDILVDSQLILLPSLIWAFDLRNRKWYPLDISLTLDVMYPDNAFENLIVPDDHKELLASLVSHHGVTSPMGNSLSMVDVAAGKGKGLVILLHGPPGVGKTLTAECLAAYARRPLLPITAADIGNTAHDVQRYLDTFFTLSQRWGCVLLFDEADIFLQARDRENIQRNSIVSVFLRTLEYYSGILIFTTNRVGTIDEGFSSRIHVVLYFRPLTRDAARKIWGNALRRASHEKMIKIDFPSILDFLESYWDAQDRLSPLNGRFISNAVQSAVALAEYGHRHKGDNGDESPRLTRRHLATVLESLKEFNRVIWVLPCFASPKNRLVLSKPLELKLC